MQWRILLGRKPNLPNRQDGRFYKNAIENSILIRLSARLYELTGKEEQLMWAKKT